MKFGSPLMAPRAAIPARGPAGFLITDAEDRVLSEHAECIGNTTNNQAEYEALIRGLAACARITAGRVRCVSDSLLLVRQMRGEYRVREATLRALYHTARDREREFAQVTYTHRARSDPHIATVDRLVNQALDDR